MEVFRFWPSLILAVWIYLVWMVLRRRVGLFRGRMEPALAEKRYKMLRAFLLVAGISLVVVAANLVVQVVVLHPPDDEGPVVFFIMLFSTVVFIIATIGGLVVYLKGRQKTT